MPVAIRLSRVGAKHLPFFRVVVVDSRKKRDGAVIEVLGTYDALKTKLVKFDADRFDEWVSKGAQPSDTAKKVYKLSKLQEAGKLPEKKAKVAKKETAKKTAPETKAEEKVAETPQKEAKAAEAPAAAEQAEPKKEEAVQATPEKPQE